MFPTSPLHSPTLPTFLRQGLGSTDTPPPGPSHFPNTKSPSFESSAQDKIVQPDLSLGLIEVETPPDDKRKRKKINRIDG